MMKRESEPVMKTCERKMDKLVHSRSVATPFRSNRQPELLKLTLTKRKRIESLYIRGDGKC